MTMAVDDHIKASADPEAAANRLEGMLEDASLRERFDALSDDVRKDLIHLISISRFLYHYICRHPDSFDQFGCKPGLDKDKPMASPQDVQSLRLFKYNELLKITWLDITQSCDYEMILASLSRLAEYTVQSVLELVIEPEHREFLDHELCVFALGKLGAEELNYSSDIDLIFVSANADESRYDIYDQQHIANNTIRGFSRLLEDKDADGFLYRVDLKLRPWGGSGPLVMPIDETESYYEASSDAWERFAWLRGRPIAGALPLGEDLKQRLQPFIYKRSLSTEDLERFVEIKNEMTRARKRKGRWNVKSGEGGIRDIEFFVQMLQIVNASRHEELQTTNTLRVLAGLEKTGYVTTQEKEEVRNSYLFLRRLENHLQMVDEQQTHELSDGHAQRLFIARALRTAGESDDEILENFENSLFASRSIARGYFERILPGDES
ncbi:MAG: hypothetical protein WD750_09460 [Gammaproteobacteria bacterium]